MVYFHPPGSLFLWKPCAKNFRYQFTELFRRGFDRFQFLPARIELRNLFLCRVAFGRELVHLYRMFSEKLRVGEQPFNSCHLRLHRVNLRFDAFELAGFLEGKFARLGGFGGTRLNFRRNLQ
jgi:hypothetical protein